MTWPSSGQKLAPTTSAPDLRQHLLDLRVVQDLTIEVLHSGLVVQTLERIGAVFQLALGEKKMQPAGLAEADIDAGLLLDGVCASCGHKRDDCMVHSA